MERVSTAVSNFQAGASAVSYDIRCRNTGRGRDQSGPKQPGVTRGRGAVVGEGSGEGGRRRLRILLAEEVLRGASGEVARQAHPRETRTWCYPYTRDMLFFKKRGYGLRFSITILQL